MKVKSVSILASVVAVCLGLFSSCKTDTGNSPNEYITTLKVVAQNLSTNHSDTFEYVNFYEAKNNPPLYVDTVRLNANATYAVQVLLLNEASNPVQYLTDTIIGRADIHLMGYNVDPSSGFLSVKMNDKDSKGLPLGMMCTWSASGPSFGLLRMILRHQQGSKNGTETPGSTDFEADFPVVVR